MRFMPFIAAGVVASAALLAGCNGTAPTLTFQQSVALVCADGKTAINIMVDDGVFTGGALDTLNKTVSPDFDKVCAVGATVTTPNLQNLTTATLPLLKTLVDGSSLQPQQKNDAKAAIDLTELAINTAIALKPAPVATVPASAPAAASSVQ